MYRTPEMVDLYANRPITEKADVWALGCLLYKLCFMVHPFEDSGILRILNANYSLPEEDRAFGAFHGTISECLPAPLKLALMLCVCCTCILCVRVCRIVSVCGAGEETQCVADSG